MIRLLFAAVLVSVLGGGSPVHAQGYPNRTIKLVVPFPAGGATDNAARLVAQRLQAGLGQSVIIENQGGAGGTIGTRQAAGAAPRVRGSDQHADCAVVVPSGQRGGATWPHSIVICLCAACPDGQARPIVTITAIQGQ